MIKENLEDQSFELTVNSSMESGTAKIKQDLHISRDCNIMFIANVFKGIMEEDESIKLGIALAVSSLISDSMSESMMNNMLSNVKAKA